MLTKKLNSIGLSVNKLKKIGQKKEEALKNQLQEEDQYREESLTLKILNRALERRMIIEKIQTVQNL